MIGFWDQKPTPVRDRHVTHDHLIDDESNSTAPFADLPQTVTGETG
jgi:hypothetical protein